MVNLGGTYQKEVVKKMMDEFGFKNFLSVPRVEKVVLNCGLGEATGNSQILEEIADHMARITGQKPVVTVSKRSIAAFKVRKGQTIGLKVTLRGARMYNFLEKLFRLTLPRLRDFRGLPIKNFDQSGNYTLGLRESNIFPELATIGQDKTRGFEITIVTNSQDLAKSKRLLELLGAAFQKT